MENNYFAELNSVNVGDHIEKKNGLSYLSWAWAWRELKTRHPDAFYTIYENPQGWNYHTDGRTAWVKTGVTVNGLEHIEYLPVMDFHNQSIPVDKVTSVAVNKTIQRSLTKAVARHGLGLYIYAGEDIPEEDTQEDSKPPKKGAQPPEKPVHNVPYYSDDDILAEVKRTGMQEDFKNYLQSKHLRDVSELTPVQAHSLMVAMKDRPTVTA